MKRKHEPKWIFKTKIGTLYKYDNNGNLLKKKKIYRRKIDHKKADAALTTIFFNHLLKNPRLILRAYEKTQSENTNKMK